MVLTGTLMVKDRKGNITNVTLNEANKKYQTLQTLSMNHHGHERYSFSLLEKVVTKDIKDVQCYEIVTVNAQNITRTLKCTVNTQVFTKGKRWSGFVSIDKLKKNAILVDDEDRVNRIVSITKIENPGKAYDVKVMYTGNFFCNGILVR